MAKADLDKLAAKALSKLATGLIGKIPGAGVVLQALVGTALDGIVAGHPSEAALEAGAAEFKADRTARDLDAIKQAIYDLGGVAPAARAPIEELAEAVADPDGLMEQERFREAMVRLFERTKTPTDDIDKLAQALVTHVTASGDGAVAVGGSIIIEKAETVHIGGTAAAPAPATALPEPPSATPPRVYTSKLPITGEHLFGRDEMLKLLDDAWSKDQANIVSLVAFGGVGKSALVNHWLGRLEQDDYHPARRVYGHSFYSQGQSDKTASADTFIAAALDWFADPQPEKGSAWAKGQRLAELVRAEPTLLILDGMEPLQHPPGPIGGRITDPALQALVRELAAQNPGLCVITTRQHVTDLDRFTSPHVRQDVLDTLPVKAGAKLLKVLGVEGPANELKQASEEFGNHALALTLLATYLKKAHAGDVRKRREVALSTADDVATGGHARRVMASYEKWLAEHGRLAELSILRLLGLFKRPAEGGCIAALRQPPPIAGLTDGIVEISDADWNVALANLREAGLVAKADSDDPEALDTHPLVREHFAERLEQEHAEPWRAGHDRLYEYLKGPGCSKELPDTVEEMAPLYAAMTHGCAAGRQQEALDDVYWRRVQRGTEAFSTKKLGAFGAELGALAGLFDEPWCRPAAALTDKDQAFILNEAGFDLRALGRLADALEPMRAGLEADVAKEDWGNAARQAENNSELLLTLGRVGEAADYAERGVGFADRSDDAFMRMVIRSTLADALHQAGHDARAEALFQEAERMQKEQQAQYPLLYSVPAYRYCDLLLARGDHQGVIERATQTLAWVSAQRWLLDIALDHLSLGRAHLLAARAGASNAYKQSREHLDLAVDGLRDAATQHHLPRGLLARAELYIFTGNHDDARADLDEALDIATRDPRGQMKLFITDCHLGYARLALAQRQGDALAGKPPVAPGDYGATAREHVTQARALIEETGYHRRDAELADLAHQANTPPVAPDCL